MKQTQVQRKASKKSTQAAATEEDYQKTYPLQPGREQLTCKDCGLKTGDEGPFGYCKACGRAAHSEKLFGKTKEAGTQKFSDAAKCTEEIVGRLKKVEEKNSELMIAEGFKCRNCG